MLRSALFLFVGLAFLYGCDGGPASDAGVDGDLDGDVDGDVDGDADPDADPDGCLPSCAGRVCGDDGCGGSCGTCGDGAACEDGACTPTSCAPGCVEGCPQGCFDLGPCAATTGAIDLHANVETLGVLLSGAGGAEVAEVYYRRPGAASWWRGHDAVRLPDGRLASSLFFLAPATTYEVMMRAGSVVACGAATTQPLVPEHETTATVHVDAAAAEGGDGSAARPFRAIAAALAVAGPGTDVVVRPGLYHEEVRVTLSGAEGRYVRLLGEPGAVLDGSSREVAERGLDWTAEGGGVWSAPWSGAPVYLARDGERLYHYTSLAGLRSGTGHNDVPMGEGFFAEGGRLYVRSSDDPASHLWQVPDLNTGFALDGAAWIWIEGFTVRYFGEGSYPKGIDVRGSSHVVVHRNHVHDTPSPVWVRRGSSFVRIEANRIHQSAVHTWPWAAVKATDHENSGINLAGGRGAIVADNLVFRIFNGIVSGSFGDDGNPDIAFDVDVYRNRVADASDDGLEPEGACINNRFWANTVDRVHSGISLAPITWGPVWVLRNRFTAYDGTGFKVSNDSSGRVWLFHNTCWTDLPDRNGMSVAGHFENMVFRNNIVRGTRYALEMSRPAGPNDLDFDNWHTPRGAPVVKWSDVRYDSLADWCAATGLECRGHSDDPGLAAPAAGAFALVAGSPNVDRGLRLYGLNDAYAGAAPDLGYLELGSPEVPVLDP